MSLAVTPSPWDPHRPSSAGLVPQRGLVLQPGRGMWPLTPTAGPETWEVGGSGSWKEGGGGPRSHADVRGCPSSCVPWCPLLSLPQGMQPDAARRFLHTGGFSQPNCSEAHCVTALPKTTASQACRVARPQALSCGGVGVAGRGGRDGLHRCSSWSAGEGGIHPWRWRLHLALEHWERLSPRVMQGHPMHPASHRGQWGWGCGWPGDAQRPEQEVFLPLPWHCWAADPIPRCGAKTVKAKAQEESEQLEPAELEGGWPWQGEGAGSRSSLAMSGTWLRSRLPCPDAARVCRPSCHPGPPCSCAYRGCGHRGAKSSSAPTCHHPGMNLAELLLPFLGAEKSCASQTQPRALLWQTTRQRNVTSSP